MDIDNTTQDPAVQKESSLKNGQSTLQAVSSDVKTDAIASLRKGVDEIQKRGSSEKPDVAESNKDEESNQHCFNPLQSGGITPKAPVSSLRKGTNPDVTDSCRIEQTLSEVVALSVEDKIPGAFRSSEDQEVFQEDIHNGYPSPSDTRESISGVTISSLGSAGPMIQNFRLTEKRLIPDTAESNKDGEDIKRSSNPVETDVTSEKRIASDVGESVKESSTNTEGLSPVETENTPECTERITSETEKNVEPSSEALGNETLDVSKNKKESGIEEKPATFAKSRKQSRKKRKMLRAAQRQLVKYPDLINAGNQGIPRGNQGISLRNQETLSRNIGSLATNQISQGNRRGKQEIPVMPVDPQYRPLNQGKQQYSILSQGSQPYRRQNQINLATLPRGDISHNPSGSYSENRKRKLDDDSSSRGVKGFKRSRHSKSSINTDLVRVIMKDSYRKECITKEELRRFRNVVSQEIDRIQVGPAPRFNHTYLKLGVIVVESVDIWSRDWLIDKVPQLYPWTGAKLQVGDLTSFEKFYKATVWIPGLIENPECILRRLEKQNPTLKTGAWRVHSREQELTPRGYNLILEIPAGSLRVLGEMNFKPYLGLDRVHVTVAKNKHTIKGPGCSSWT